MKRQLSVLSSLWFRLGTHLYIVQHEDTQFNSNHGGVLHHKDHGIAILDVQLRASRGSHDLFLAS